jgi:TetR/AcrR family transcriptional regulator
MKERPGSTTSRRAEILRSAVAAFRRRGYHGASVDEIAGTLGMTKGNLYYYFKNKEEILFFCHDWSLDILLDRLDEVQAQGGPPDRKLRRLIVAFVHMIIDELHGTALTLDLQALSPAHLKRVIAKRDRFDRGLRGIIEDGIASGAFAPGDPKLLTFAVLGAANWITRWYDPKGSATSDEIGNAFAEFCMRGMQSIPRTRRIRARRTLS